MGCSGSVPDPNLIYGDKVDPNHNKPISNEKNKIHPQKNGSVKHGRLGLDNADVIDGSDKRTIKNRELKGDLITYNNARLSREKNMMKQLVKREKLAQEMSAKVMDEKERLSLSTTRSLATSRTNSPRPVPSRAHPGQLVLSSSPRGNATADPQTEHTLPRVSESDTRQHTLPRESDTTHKDSGSNKIVKPTGTNSQTLAHNGTVIVVANYRSDNESRDTRELTNHKSVRELQSQGLNKKSFQSVNESEDTKIDGHDSTALNSEHSTPHDALLKGEHKNKKDKSKRHKNKSKKGDQLKESTVSIRSDTVSHG